MIIANMEDNSSLVEVTILYQKKKKKKTEKGTKEKRTNEAARYNDCNRLLPPQRALIYTTAGLKFNTIDINTTGQINLCVSDVVMDTVEAAGGLPKIRRSTFVQSDNLESTYNYSA